MYAIFGILPPVLNKCMQAITSLTWPITIEHYDRQMPISSGELISINSYLHAKKNDIHVCLQHNHI